MPTPLIKICSFDTLEDLVYNQTIMKINEKNLLYMLSNIRNRAFNFLQTEMKKKGIEDIPPSYGDILYAIKVKNRLSVKEICEISQKDKSTVSVIVNNLVKSGYAIKERDTADARSVKIRLSKKAEVEGEKMMDISRKLNERLYKGLSEEEKAIFFMLLKKIAVNI